MAGCTAAPSPSLGIQVATSDPTVQQTFTTDAGTLLVGAAESDARAWLDRVTRSVRAVEAADLGALVEGWDHRLTVELPADAEQYATSAGSDGAGAAAVTRCLAGKSRIVVNPAVRAQPAGYLDGLVRHEAVHVATDSACRTGGPSWLNEGLAEWVATRHDTDGAAANRAWVRWYLDQHGVPSRLPSDAEFAGSDSDGLLAGYALAELAVEVAIAHLGHSSAVAYFADLRAGTDRGVTTADLTTWYVAELARLAESA